MAEQRELTGDPLLAGFYNVRDAARLLGIDSTARLRGWLTGWPNARAGPIVQRQFVDTSTVSFLDLMELRFIDYFRAQKVPLQTLRRAADKARLHWETTHPFALSKSKYITDRRKIFAQSAEEQKDTITWDLATNQLEMWEALESAIARGVEFSPSTDLAERWRPKGSEFPDVIVDPHYAFGHPVIGSRAVPTSAIFSLYKAECGKSDQIAKWFNVTVEHVNQAVQFEIELSA